MTQDYQKVKLTKIIEIMNSSERTVLVDIWKSMPTQKIIQNTTFNIFIKIFYFC